MTVLLVTDLLHELRLAIALRAPNDRHRTLEKSLVPIHAEFTPEVLGKTAIVLSNVFQQRNQIGSTGINASEEPNGPSPRNVRQEYC